MLAYEKLEIVGLLNAINVPFQNSLNTANHTKLSVLYLLTEGRPDVPTALSPNKPLCQDTEHFEENSDT